MTSIVGVLCEDGVVIGADSSATFSSPKVKTIEQPIRKIEVVGDQIIVVGTGSGGMDQRFCAVVSNCFSNGGFNTNEIEIGKTLSAAGQQDFIQTGAPKGAYGALVAYPAGGSFHLCELDVPSFQPELKEAKGIWYCSMGSAQPITDPFLGFISVVVWEGGIPNLHE